jgi:F-type H+-transporting ATPase subunit b
LEFSWSTFVLEIINFLVLLWILNRFLYRPVLDIIAHRRQQIESSLAQARQQREQGEALQRQYDNRLDDWAREKESARKALDREIEEERGRRHEGLKRELEANRRKVEVVEARDRKQREQQLEVRALALAGRFAARLFTRIAGPEVERKLVEMAVEDLSELPPDQLETLRRAWESEGDSIEVTTAGALDKLQRRAIEDGLGRLVNRPVTCRYREDPQLISGLCVRLGPWMLHANLRDELKSFVEAARPESPGE